MRTAVRRRCKLCLALALALAGAAATPAAADFPQADAGYHSYDEVVSEMAKVEAAHPSLMRRFSIGTSWEGREIQALKISDNVAVDEAEPEVLFDAGQHAREHLSIEMAVYLLNELTSAYATDARIRNAVDTREIWIVPNLNPDGSEYDIASGTGYRSWRKNRQPNPGSDEIGTDLNRNWGHRWGCCGGSSSNPASEEFRGASAFSTPEAQRLRDFVLSRRIGGVQQIRTSIDFHTYGELVMWPFAYTLDDTAPGMTLDQRNAFAALGQSMAASNGFKAQQASDLYISDGNLRDWLWASEGIFAYGFELWGRQGGFYPPDEFIAQQTTRNREAALQLIEAADCPYRPSGQQDEYCAAAPVDPPPPGGATPPPPPPGPGTGAATQTPATPRPPPQPPSGDTADHSATTRLLASRAALGTGGHVRLRVRCATVEQPFCRGTIKLRARLPGARAIVTVAKANYVVRTGTSAITLRLGPKSRRALRRRSAVTVTAIVTTRQDETGADTSSTARVKLVRAPARRR